MDKKYSTFSVRNDCTIVRDSPNAAAAHPKAAIKRRRQPIAKLNDDWTTTLINTRSAPTVRIASLVKTNLQCAACTLRGDEIIAALLALAYNIVASRAIAPSSYRPAVGAPKKPEYSRRGPRKSSLVCIRHSKTILRCDTLIQTHPVHVPERIASRPSSQVGFEDAVADM